MKINLSLLLSILFLIPLSALDFFESRTMHYLVKSDASPEDSVNAAMEMEERYSLYADLIGTPSGPQPLLPVTILSSREEIETYLNGLKALETGDVVLLRQKDSGRGEIVCLSVKEASVRKALNQAAFLQFIESCNRDTPLWLKSGMALYFETSPDPSTGEPFFNWSALAEWMDMDPGVNDINDSLLTLSDESKFSYREQVLSWSLLTYLMNSQGKDSRLIWESLSLVRTGETKAWPQELPTDLNSRLISYFSELHLPDTKEQILKTYYESSSYDELMEYISRDDDISSGVELYYRGLVHYNRGLFEEALDDFGKAGELGFSPAETVYAKALCYLQLGDRVKAVSRLKTAEKLKEGIVPEELSRLLE
ncbi:MAG: hypothetical protein JXA95_11380 [Spirochaetales bacterium]|nr:hypothetical protein [Spirochaetales bacterium]